MATKRTSAEQYLAWATEKNAERAQQQRIGANIAAKAAGLKVPDLNPADRAVARLQAHAAATKIKEEFDKTPVDRNTDLRDRVARLENLLQLTLDSLNAASIECSGGSVVLTLPDLPT
jgi:hypothetical protein